METIKNSAILTLQIIDGILDFSKIEHGVIELQIYPFSLRDCIESALQLVAEPAATKNLELAYSNRCPHINMVYGDITRFRQCVINLIGNSVKFTQSGHILVTTKADRVPESDKWQIQVSVEDTGIGIPEQGFSKYDFFVNSTSPVLFLYLSGCNLGYSELSLRLTLQLAVYTVELVLVWQFQRSWPR